MQVDSTKFLVGLVGPDVLSAIEEDSLNPVFLDLQACNALEIRYDFFEQAQWPGLSGRLRKVAPHAMQIGTIRLHRDGGKFPDRDAVARPELWQKILEAAEVPEWLDLERDCLSQFADLKKAASARGTRILVKKVGIPVGVKIQQQAVVPENPCPLFIGLPWVGKVPGQIPADDDVKAAVVKVQFLGVHLKETDPVRQSASIFAGFFKHGGCQVDRGDLKSQFTQKDGKKTGARPDIQGMHAARVPAGKMSGDLIFQEALPFFLLLCREFRPVHFRISGGPPGPVALVL